MNLRVIFLFILTALVVAGCTSPTSEVVNEVENKELPLPEAGKATVTGHVISSTTNETLSDFIVRLAEVVRPPEEQGGDIFILDQAFSPGTKTDSNGIFIFENVDPKEYVIVVGDIERTYEVVAGEDGLPSVWNALPDEVTNFGEISVSLVPADR